jgi:ABC-type methionine transport system permease subunit
MRHIAGMTEETFINLSRWSFLIILIAINIPAFRMVLGAVMGIVAAPFLLIYRLIAG